MAAIRPGRAEDLHAVAAIQSASPQAAAWPVDDYLQQNFLVAEEAAEEFAEEASEAANHIVAFLIWRAVAPGEAEILNLAVVPQARRRGVARQLLTTALNGFVGDVFLEVRASNVAAITFYKSHSFQQVGLRPRYYDNPPESAIVMKFHSC